MAKSSALSDTPQMDARWNSKGELILFTRYKGHNFEGWINKDSFHRMEEDGVLSWNDGKPKIDESKVKPPTVNRGPKWIGEGI